MLTMMRWLALALVVAACNHTAEPVTPGTGSSAPADAPIATALDRDLPRLAGRALALYQGVASAFAGAGEDCAVATTKLDALATEFADVVAANGKVLRDHRAKEMRAALEPHQTELDVAAHAIMDSKTLAACSPDKRFENAFDRLMAP